MDPKEHSKHLLNHIEIAYFYGRNVSFQGLAVNCKTKR